VVRHRVRPLPLLLATLAGALLLAALRLALVVESLDPDANAARLREEARERTGHDLTLEGLDLSLLPPTVTLTDMTLGPAPGFGPEPFAQVERVQASLRLLPLLERRLEVGAVRVDGLQVALVRGPSGRGSWETLREHLGGLRGEEREGVPDLPALGVRGAQVRYRDLGTGREVEIRDLTLRVGRALGQASRSVALEGTLHSADPEATGQIAASARMLAPPGARVELRDARLDATLAVGGRTAALHATGEAELDTTRAQLSASTLAAHLEASGAGLPAPVAVDLAGVLRADLSQGRLWLEEATLTAAGLRAAGALAVEGLPEAPAASGQVTLAHQDLGAALAILGHPLDLRDPAALREVSATIPFAWAADALTLSPLDLRLGGARMTGHLVARGVHPPDLGFELDVSELDLDGLRPAAEGGSAWPPEGLAEARLAGRLRGHDLRLGGVTVEYLDLPLALSGGRLKVDQASVTALGGGLGFELDANLVQAEGRQRAAGELITLDLARALEALGSQRGLTGTAQAQGVLSATGLAPDTLRASLDGNLCIALLNGILPLERAGDADTQGRPLRARRAGHTTRALSGVAERVVTLARERVGGQVPTKLTYRRIEACFDLQRGMASTSDLLLDADELKLQGAGQIDLGASALDLTCLVTLGELLPMGMHIHGPLADPLVEMDKPERMELVRGLMEHRREERREKVQEQRQALRDDLRSLGREGLDTLLDGREQAVERRDEVREQVREKVEDVRDAARERRQQAREKVKEKLGKDVEAEDDEEPAESEGSR